MRGWLDAEARHYGCAMAPGPSGNQPVVIDGRIARRTSSGLTMTFHEGEDEPLAVAVQSGGEGRGAQLGVLFGFKNGGPGRHSLSYPTAVESSSSHASRSRLPSPNPTVPISAW
jgi:hypothetical protein